MGFGVVGSFLEPVSSSDTEPLSQTHFSCSHLVPIRLDVQAMLSKVGRASASTWRYFSIGFSSVDTLPLARSDSRLFFMHIVNIQY